MLTILLQKSYQTADQLRHSRKNLQIHSKYIKIEDEKLLHGVRKVIKILYRKM